MINSVISEQELNKLYEEYPIYPPPYGTRFKDRTGMRYGKVTILYRTLDRFWGGKKRTFYVAKCDCGTVFEVHADTLLKREKNKNVYTCGKCSISKLFQHDEIDNWTILNDYCAENDADRSHTIIQCKTCGLVKDVRTSTLTTEHGKETTSSLICKVCNMAKNSGLYAGYKQGFLSILSYKAEDSGRAAHPLWMCKCERCNTTVIKDTANFKRSKSCGCLSGISAEQEIGKKYGRLTIIKIIDKTEYSTNSRALCKCECGGFTETAIINLKNGHTQSCGCLVKEVGSYRKSLDLRTGDRFGRLTVLEYVGTDEKGHSKYKCICNCGTIIETLGYLLTTGETQSCGCLSSKGEEKISQLLTEHKVLFQKEKTYDSCRFSDTGAKARYDFYLPEYNYLIEFDGVQHFKYNKNAVEGKTWNTRENYEYTKRHDEYKNQWCKENNIPLIRIPYVQLPDLCIEDLMLETTKFRVV
jgi:hypothetical protein